MSHSVRCPLAVFRPWRLCLRAWEHRMVLAGQLHCLALYHTHCSDDPEATQRREVGTVQGGDGVGPLLWLEQVGHRPENPKCSRTSKSSGHVSGKTMRMRMWLIPWSWRKEGGRHLRMKWHQGRTGLCQVSALEWWIMPVMAHVARLQCYLKRLMRHPQSQILSLKCCGWEGSKQPEQKVQRELEVAFSIICHRDGQHQNHSIRTCWSSFKTILTAAPQPPWMMFSCCSWIS